MKKRNLNKTLFWVSVLTLASLFFWVGYANNLSEPVAMEWVRNGVDTSTFVEKLTIDGKVFYKDTKWAFWSEDFLNWKGEKVYKIAPKDLKYTTVMNLKLSWHFNDFQHLISNNEANQWEEHLTRIEDRFGVKIAVAIVQSRENNAFDEIYYSILGKNKGIDCLLLYVQDEKKFYIKALDALKLNQEELGHLVNNFPSFNTTQSEQLLKSFKAWFLELYLKANPGEKQWLVDAKAKTREIPVAREENVEVPKVDTVNEEGKVVEKETFSEAEIKALIWKCLIAFWFWSLLALWVHWAKRKEE